MNDPAPGLALDLALMRAALAEARKAEEAGEVPVGAVVSHDGEIVAAAGNRVIVARDPTAHAEILALREAAGRIGNYRLVGCELHVTVEPCLMCAGAAAHARIRRIAYGPPEPKFGAVESRLSLSELGLPHVPETAGGILAEESRVLLQSFFRKRRGGVRDE